MPRESGRTRSKKRGCVETLQIFRSFMGGCDSTRDFGPFRTFLRCTGLLSSPSIGRDWGGSVFVLSGWLLGGLLFREADWEGGFDCRRFWVRRWMRTLPAYMSFCFLTLGSDTLRKITLIFLGSICFSFKTMITHLASSVSVGLCVSKNNFI